MEKVNGRRVRVLNDSSLKEHLDDGFVSRMDVEKAHALGGLAGLVVVRDHTGRVIARRKNLVVQRGRLFALEMIFGLSTGTNRGTSNFEYWDESGGLVDNANRKVCLFGIGSGGTAPDSPFSPLVPNPTDLELTDPVPFKVLNTSLSETLAAPALADTLYNYMVPDETDADNVLNSYFLKRVGQEVGFAPVWEVDPDTNLISLRNDLIIDDDDAGDAVINEIGLYIAQEDLENEDYFLRYDKDQIELFSHFTFQSEPPQQTKRMAIQYYVFS
jgi:hypothetical protein